MVKRVAGLQGTKDVSDWEDQFIASIVQKTREGEDTSGLSERQITALERLFEKHFAA